MQNDKFASQKYQDPLATMPRICNPEAMSNDRGPAAEGVAHKIINIGASAGLHRPWQLMELTRVPRAVGRLQSGSRHLEGVQWCSLELSQI